MVYRGIMVTDQGTIMVNVTTAPGSSLEQTEKIMEEIDRRYREDFMVEHGDRMDLLRDTAILWDGQVRMANLCVCACSAVNGVSALHSDILKADVFHDAYQMFPKKFQNVTNGVDHRRWLSEVNPQLDSLIRECCGGDKYLLQPSALSGLEKYAGDASVLKRLGEIKAELKEQGYFQEKTVQHTDGAQQKETVAGPAFYEWEDGCLFSIESNEEHEGETYSLPVLFFNAEKWRSPLGAYCFYDCSAGWGEATAWNGYSVGSEMIS